MKLIILCVTPVIFPIIWNKPISKQTHCMIWASKQENLSSEFANNLGTDQTDHQLVLFTFLKAS